jgi:hypothetical protein
MTITEQAELAELGMTEADLERRRELLKDGAVRMAGAAVEMPENSQPDALSASTGRRPRSDKGKPRPKPADATSPAAAPGPTAAEKVAEVRALLKELRQIEVEGRELERQLRIANSTACHLSERLDAALDALKQ